MDLEKLRIFYDLILAGGVRKLSEINHQPIAKISRYLSSLEQEIGHVLIERKQGNARLTLTDQGKILFETLPTIFGIFDNLQQVMDTRPELYSGRLTIYTTNSLIEDWLISMLHDFYNKFPEIKIDLLSHNILVTPELRKRIISISPTNEFIDDDVVQFPLLDYHVGLWASPGYLEHFGTPQSLKDLERHKLIVYSKEINQMTYSSLHWHLQDINIKLNDLTCINTSNGLIKAAHAGLGIISLSAENVAASGIPLQRVLPHIHGPKVTMCLTYPKYWYGNKIIQTVQNYFSFTFKEHSKRLKADFI